jgi:hypothetical protein
MRHLIHHAEELRARPVLLDVGDASARAAIRLYRQFGFAPCEPFTNGWPTGIHLALTLPHSAPHQEFDVRAVPNEQPSSRAADQG